MSWHSPASLPDVTTKVVESERTIFFKNLLQTYQAVTNINILEKFLFLILYYFWGYIYKS